MIDLMLGQQRRSKIPAGLPSQISVANKTGESPGVENDSAWYSRRTTANISPAPNPVEATMSSQS